MSASDWDDEVRELFSDLRGADGTRAPSFPEMRREAERRMRPDAEAPRGAPRDTRLVVRAWWLAAAAGLILAATLVGRHARRSDPLGDPPGVDAAMYPSILAWTPPTDELMRLAQRSASPPSSAFGSLFDGLTTGFVPLDSFK